MFTDLTVVFRNVALVPLTPYSATFVGRRIEEKLKRVAEALGKHPRLKLTVHGGYEAKADGVRSLQVRR